MKKATLVKKNAKKASKRAQPKPKGPKGATTEAGARAAWDRLFTKK